MNETLIKKIFFRLIILLFSMYSIWYIILAYFFFNYLNQRPESSTKLTLMNFLFPLFLTIIFILIYNIILYFKSIKTNNILFAFCFLASAYSIYWMAKVLIFEIDRYNLVSFGTALFCIINVNIIIYKNRKTQSSRIDSAF